MLGYEFHAHSTLDHDKIVPYVRKASQEVIARPPPSPSSPVAGNRLTTRRNIAPTAANDDDDDDPALPAKIQPKLEKPPPRVCRNGLPLDKIIYIKVGQSHRATMAVNAVETKLHYSPDSALFRRTKQGLPP